MTDEVGQGIAKKEGTAVLGFQGGPGSEALCSGLCHSIRTLISASLSGLLVNPVQTSSSPPKHCEMNLTSSNLRSLQASASSRPSLAF